jgi:hypothetical protein
LSVLKNFRRFVMKRAGHAISLAAGCLLAATAFSDCIDYSEARAAQAGAALEKNPPSAAQLGLPSLDGFRLNGAATTGDPKCGGPNPPKTYTYSTNLSLRDVLTAYYANIQPYIEEDGMKRKWFRNPYWSKGLFTLTSGTEVSLNTDASGKISSIRFTPAPTVLPLTSPKQPYSVEEMIIGTPWPGGPNGPREFVRADSPAGVAPAAGGTATASSGGTVKSAPASSKCQPKAGGTSSDAGEDVAAEVGGRVLGGGFGRNVGGALGGLLGKAKQPPPADPDCQ